MLYYFMAAILPIDTFHGVLIHRSLKIFGTRLSSSRVEGSEGNRTCSKILSQQKSASLVQHAAAMNVMKRLLAAVQIVTLVFARSTFLSTSTRPVPKVK